MAETEPRAPSKAGARGTAARRRDFEVIRDAALAIGQTSAAVQAANALQDLDVAEARRKETARIARIKDPVLRLREQARAAQREKGWTAAEKFEAAALAIERERDARAKTDAEEQLLDLSVDQLVEQIAGLAATLSQPSAERLLRALLDRGDLDPRDI